MKVHLDFETYSEFDLKTGGAWGYSKHHSTEALCMGYTYGNEEPQLWRPGEPLPDFVKRPADFELHAWNAPFEIMIWHNTLHWTEAPLHLWHDTMAKAAAMALPMALGTCAKVLGLPEDKQKDKRGRYLIQRLCKPYRGERVQDWVLLDELYKYCLQDVIVEREIDRLLLPLRGVERDVWLLDQKINFRGVYIDREVAEAIIETLDTRALYLNKKFQLLTKGVVSGARSFVALKQWVAQEANLTLETIDKEKTKEILSADVPQHVKDVLEIKMELSKSSTAKFKSAVARTTDDDPRARGLFAYHAAATGRWAGRGIQLQNLPRSSYVDHDFDSARRLFIDRDAQLLEILFDLPQLAASRMVRGTVMAAPGRELVCADFSAIEGRGLAYLAGEDWVLEEYRRLDRDGGPDMYMVAAAVALGKKPGEITKSERQNPGKISELACFGPDTLVATDSGWKPIVAVTKADLVFDGLSFVNHSGVAYRGKRNVIDLCGVTVTPDHKILIGDAVCEDWRRADDLLGNTTHLSSALSLASLLLRESCTALWGGSEESPVDALAETTRSLSGQIYAAEKQNGATDVRKKRVETHKQNTPTSAQTSNYGSGCSTGSTQQYHAVTTPPVNISNSMGGGASTSVMNGDPTQGSSYRTYSPLMDMTTPLLRWTGSTIRRVTNLVMSALSAAPKTTGTNEPIEPSSIKGDATSLLIFIKSFARNIVALLLSGEKSEKDSPQNKSSKTSRIVKEHTFDILNAGPGNRFTILTEKGPLIAHNCGYQGGAGAVRAFGGGEDQTDEEIYAKIVTPWRQARPNIVKFWYDLEDAAKSAINEPGSLFPARGIEYKVLNDTLFCKLPSGRLLSYCRPRLEEVETPWGAKKQGVTFMGMKVVEGKTTTQWGKVVTHGGKLCENVVQAFCRDLLAEAMLRLDHSGYNIVAHIHDEIICEEPIGAKDLDTMCLLMSEVPSWAEGMPIAASGWVGQRYRKD